MNTLTGIEIRVLHEVLDDEDHARSIHHQGVADFAEVRPFITIRQAEVRPMHGRGWS